MLAKSERVQRVGMISAHESIRKSCKKCHISHTPNEHRFHGVHKFCGYHEGNRHCGPKDKYYTCE